jgi:hypothetical protein
MKIKTTGRVVAWLVTGFSSWAKFANQPRQVKTGWRTQTFEGALFLRSYGDIQDDVDLAPDRTSKKVEIQILDNRDAN